MGVVMSQPQDAAAASAAACTATVATIPLMYVQWAVYEAIDMTRCADFHMMVFL
jgi:hypothetical protein